MRQLIINVSDVTSCLKQYDQQRGVFRKFVRKNDSISPLRSFADQLRGRGLTDALNKREVYSLAHILIQCCAYDEFVNQMLVGLVQKFDSLQLKALSLLTDRNMLTITNCDVIFPHSNLPDLVTAMEYLQKDLLLSQDTFSAIANTSNHPSKMVRAIMLLKQNNLLNKESLAQLVDHQFPFELAEAMRVLKRENLLSNSEAREHVYSHDYPFELARGYALLNSCGILTNNNCNELGESSKLYSIIPALDTLSKEGILDQVNFSDVMKYNNFSQDVMKSLTIIDGSDIWDEESRNKIINHGNIKQVTLLLQKLKSNDLLDRCIFDTTMSNAQSVVIVEALCYLKKARIYCKQYFNEIISYSRLDVLIISLEGLSKKRLLNDESFNVIIHHDSPIILASVIRHLSEENLLSSRNFDRVLRHTPFVAMAGAIKELSMADILDEKHFNIVVKHSAPQETVKAFILLKKIGIEGKSEKLSQHKAPWILVQCLSALHNSNLLTDANEQKLFQISSLSGLLQAFEDLGQAKLVSQLHVDLLCQHQDPRSLAVAICHLSHSGILNHVNLLQLSRDETPLSVANKLLHKEDKIAVA